MFLTSQRMPSRYNALAGVYNCRIYRRIKYLRVVFFWNIFYEHSIIGNDTYFTDTKMGVADVIALTRAF